MARRRKVPKYMRDNPDISRAREVELLASFWGYRYQKTDLSEFIEADVTKQNRGCGEKGYYITTVHECRSCGIDFRFTAEEQKVWFEEYGFYIDAYPGCCLECRTAIRRDKVKKKRYDDYHTDNDGELTTTECRELADLIMDLFGPELDESMKNRYNRMLNRIRKDEESGEG